MHRSGFRGCLAAVLAGAVLAPSVLLVAWCILFSVLSVPRVDGAGFPPGTVVAVDDERGDLAVVNSTAGTVDLCGGRRVKSWTSGAAATFDGGVLTTYDQEDDTVAGPVTGVDLLTDGCQISNILLLEGRWFAGIAVDPEGQAWVTDIEQDELLKLDVERAEVVHSIPLPNKAILEDIDADGFFYLRTPGPECCGFRSVLVLSPTGETVREFGVDGAALARVRVGENGNLWISSYYSDLVPPGLYEVSPYGTVLRRVRLPSSGEAFALSPGDTLWASSVVGGSGGDPALAHFTREGTELQRIAIDAVGSPFSWPDFVAFVPPIVRGSAQETESPSGGCSLPGARESSSGWPLLLAVGWLLWRCRGYDRSELSRRR